MKSKGVSLVVGGDGVIGRGLVSHLTAAGETVFATTRRRGTLSERRILLDLEKDVSNWHPPCPVSVAYLCAAGGDIEHCRKNPLQSAVVNVQNIVALAKMLAAGRTFLVFPSTNLVYDGAIPYREATTPVCPQTEYGRQKAEAEARLAVLGNLVSIVRLTKVLSPDMPLIRGWIRALRNNEVIHPFRDMVLAPVSLSFAVEVLYRIAKLRLPGIVQVSGREDVTYEEVARHIARRLGVSLKLVQAVSAKEAGVRPEAIPSSTTFDTSRLRMALGMEPPDVYSTINSVLGSR